MVWREADCIICGNSFGWDHRRGTPRNTCGEECRREKNRKRLEEYRGKNRKRSEEYNRNNREKVNKANREWRLKNREKDIERKRKYRSENLAKIREYEANRRVRDPLKIKQYDNNRRARKKAAFVEDVDPFLLALKHGGECGICGGKINLGLSRPHPLSMQVDHIIPLSKGGEHSYANCQPAHASCNYQKGTKLDGWQNIKPILEEPSAV